LNLHRHGKPYGTQRQIILAKGRESVDVLIDTDHPERYTVTSVESISMKKR
jgi:hypothetical protein